MRQRKTTARPPEDSPRPSPAGIRRSGIAVAGLVGLVVLAGACGSGSPITTTTAGSSATGGAQASMQAAAPTNNAGTSNADTSNTATSNTGAGPVTRPGSGSTAGSGNESADNYSVAFAACMRVHGVPTFPDPNGSAGLLGPGSGVNPASAAFQAALHGPCLSLAPAGWVSSGQVGR